MPEQKKDMPRLQTLNYDPVLFHNDEQLYFVYKKVEAISGAVFLITHSVADTEVIKSTLREQSIKSMNQIVSLISKSKVDVSDIQIISSSVTYINSLLDIAFWSGVVSQMNVSLIQREIAQVYKVVNDLVAKYKETFFLDSEFFSNTLSSAEESKSVQPAIESRPSSHHADPKIPESLIARTNTNNSGENKETKKQIKQIIQQQPNTSYEDVLYKGQIKRQELKDIKNVQLNKPKVSNTDRRDTILDLIKEKGSIGIKDVSTVIPLVSEKTIQRELLALVSEGIVKKEGERRWSTYSLNTN